MKLGAATIAQHARDAGFYGDAVKHATAIALASSGGLTHYQHRAGIPGSGDWRGLFAVNVDEHAHLVELELYDPIVNAWAAHELTTSEGGFGWSAAYRNGWHHHWLDHVVVESTREPHKDRAVEPYTIHLSHNRIETALERVRHHVASRVRHG